LKTAIVLLIAIILSIFVFYFIKHWQPALVEEKGYEEAAGLACQEALRYSEKTDSLKREAHQDEISRLSEKFSDLEPVTPQDCFRLGILYLQDREYARAKMPLELAAKSIPSSSSVWQALSADYKALGEEIKAKNAEIKAKILAKRAN
jgi:predicted Zn-dependent protease